MRRTYALLFAYLLFSGCCRAQTTTDSRQPLLRIERSQPGEVSCVLVDDDGSYRLEKMYRAKTDSYTGRLDSVQLNRLQTLLGNDRLAKLSQGDIHDSLIGDTIDILQVAILREHGWQELSFPSPDSRKGLKESVDPLLHWFQDVQKQRPAAVRGAGDPTRCMPPRNNQHIVVSSVQSQTSMQSSAVSADYLFRLLSSYAYVERGVENTCTVVFKDGRFRRERSHQEYMGKRRDKIAEGKLDPATLKDLSDILNSSELKGAPDAPDTGNQKPLYMQEGTVTTLSVPREGKIQNIFFLTAQNTIGNPREIGGASNLGYHVTDRKALEPLLHWMKENTDKQSRKLESDGLGNGCYPVKPAASSDNPAGR